MVGCSGYYVEDVSLQVRKYRTFEIHIGLCKSRHLPQILRMVLNCSKQDSRPQMELLMLSLMSPNQDLITFSALPETET